MYYLRKEPYEETIGEIRKTDGTIIPERKYITDDRAIYKAHQFSRFYRQTFMGMDVNPPGMKLYTCKTLKKILELRQLMYDYCGEWFDVYNENGNVNFENQ